MPFTPEEVERQEFASSLTGYDKTEVRAFLRALAAQLRREADGQPLRVAIDKDLIARTRELIDRSENSLRRLAKAAEESGHLNVVRLKDEAAADRQALTRMAKEAMAGIQETLSTHLQEQETHKREEPDARQPENGDDQQALLKLVEMLGVQIAKLRSDIEQRFAVARSQVAPTPAQPTAAPNLETPTGPDAEIRLDEPEAEVGDPPPEWDELMSEPDLDE
jgi:DivIVA domain-containing protein